MQKCEINFAQSLRARAKIISHFEHPIFRVSLNLFQSKKACNSSAIAHIFLIRQIQIYPKSWRSKCEINFARALRACEIITFTFMHLIFEPYLSLSQSKKARHRLTMPLIFLNRQTQIWPKSECLKVKVITSQALKREKICLLIKYWILLNTKKKRSC